MLTRTGTPTWTASRFLRAPPRGRPPGNKAYCRFAETDTRVQCTVTAERSETFSVTSTDSMSMSFGVALSQGTTEGLTQGKETGKTVQVCRHRRAGYGLGVLP